MRKRKGREMSTWDPAPTGGGTSDDDASGFTEFVNELFEVEGVLKAALLDRSGRVLAAEGFPDREELMETASLTAGLHTSGARLGEAVHDRGFPRTLLDGADRSVLVTSLPVRAGVPLVLLVVADGTTLESMGVRLEEVSGVTAPEGSGVGLTDDPEKFEASLLESLDRLFPKDEETGEA